MIAGRYLRICSRHAQVALRRLRSKQHLRHPRRLRLRTFSPPAAKPYFSKVLSRVRRTCRRCVYVLCMTRICHAPTQSCLPTAKSPNRTTAANQDFGRTRSLRSLRNFCPLDAPAAQQHALAFAECVVCFDDMHKECAGVFAKDGARVCPHFLHYRCAEDVRTGSRGGAHCPICRSRPSNPKPLTH